MEEVIVIWLAVCGIILSMILSVLLDVKKLLIQYLNGIQNHQQIISHVLTKTQIPVDLQNVSMFGEPIKVEVVNKDEYSETGH